MCYIVIIYYETFVVFEIDKLHVHMQAHDDCWWIECEVTCRNNRNFNLSFDFRESFTITGLRG